MHARTDALSRPGRIWNHATAVLCAWNLKSFRKTHIVVRHTTTLWMLPDLMADRRRHPSSNRGLTMDVSDSESAYAPNRLRGTSEHNNSERLGSMGSSHRDIQGFPSSGFSSSYSVNRFTGNGTGSNVANARDFIDSLVSLMGLTPDQSADLVQLSKWGSKLDTGDLLIRLSCHANQFRIENLVLKLVNKENATASILADLQKMLQKKWQMSELQTRTVRTVGKDLIFNPKYTDYKKLSTRVKQTLEPLPEFEGVFTNPHRLSVTDREIGKTCRHIRNEYRKALRDTTFGANRLTLEEAVSDLAERFLLGGLLKITKEHTVHIAILRRFARDNRQILVDEEDEDEEDDVGHVSEDEQQNGRKRRKRTNNNNRRVGRVPKGKDWWSQVQKWFTEKKRLWGTTTDTTEWKRYVAEILSEEKSLEDSSDSINVLPSGPILSTMSINNFDNSREVSPFIDSPRLPQHPSSRHPSPSQLDDRPPLSFQMYRQASGANISRQSSRSISPRRAPFHSLENREHPPRRSNGILIDFDSQSNDSHQSRWVDNVRAFNRDCGDRNLHTYGRDDVFQPPEQRSNGPYSGSSYNDGSQNLDSEIARARRHHAGSLIGIMNHDGPGCGGHLTGSFSGPSGRAINGQS